MSLFLCRYICVATFYVAILMLLIFVSLFFMPLYLCRYFLRSGHMIAESAQPSHQTLSRFMGGVWAWGRD